MRFKDIPGHEDVKTRLRQLVDSDRIPHALLLEGLPGAGQYLIARALAQYIHCQRRTPDGDSCGQCPNCQQHQTFNHIDTVFSFPIVKKGQVAISNDFIDEFRELMTESPFMDFEKWQLKLDNINAQPMIFVDEANELIRRLNYTAHGSKYKIVIMWLPERMKEETSNKLLKLIEEPHEDTLFILASDNSRLILPTIYSRTQRINVTRYDDATIRGYLVSEYGISEESADQIARLAMGNMNVAINQINVTKDYTLYFDLFKELMRKAYTRSIADLKKWAADVAALGREREMKFLDYCARLLRENFILNMHNEQLNYLNQEEMSFSRNFSPFINERNVEKLFKVINDARADIAANANAKLVNFDVAIKVILLLKSPSHKKC